MDKFFELLESVVFRVDRSGAITPLNKAANALLGERPRDASSLTVLFGETSHARLAVAATNGSARTCAIGASRIKWELILPDGKEGDVLAVGIDWKPAAELVEQMAKETLIFKELVMNVAPRFVVDAMLQGKAVQPKAYRETTIVFAGAIGFAELAAEMDPVAHIKKLDRVFATLDHAASTYGLEKLKTIGDEYMAVSGIPFRKASHAVDAVLFSLDVLRATQSGAAGGVPLDCRIGVHSGPIIAGVLGSSKYMFDVWGETVSVAAAVESAARPGKLTISEKTLEFTADFFETTQRTAANHRGQADVPLFEIERLKPEYADASGAPNDAFRERYRELFLPATHSASIAPPPRFMR